MFKLHKMGMQVPISCGSRNTGENSSIANSGKILAACCMIWPGKRRAVCSKAPATRPCAYAGLHPAQVCRGSGGGLCERQECDPHPAHLSWPAQELRWHEFLGTGYFVSTASADVTTVRAYIRDQEKEDQRLEQLHLFK